MVFKKIESGKDGNGKLRNHKEKNGIVSKTKSAKLSIQSKTICHAYLPQNICKEQYIDRSRCCPVF
jgi:hypothetical protein